MKDVREILLHDWDPIGVSDWVEAKDEYDSYVFTVCTMLRDGKNAADIQAYLMSVTKDQMGLTPDTGRTAAVAEKLASLVI